MQEPASSCGVTAGSAAMLKAPNSRRSSTRQYASATSRRCKSWNIVVRGRQDRDLQSPRQQAGDQRAQEVPSDFASGIALESEAGPEPGHPDLRMVSREPVKQAFLLGLVLAVVRAGYPRGRP